MPTTNLNMNLKNMLPSGSDSTSQPPKIKIDSLSENEEIHAFHRYCQDTHGNFFMTQTKTMGALHPSMGITDGWTTAVVCANWDRANYDYEKQNTWPLVRWTHPLWYDRRGRNLDVTQLSHVTQRIPASQIRKLDESGEATEKPLLSILSVRWGGHNVVDPVTEGVGGWGNIGSTCSDNYINAFECQVFDTIGPCYEIFSCFVQSSSELKKLQTPLLKHQLRGKFCGAQYYLWPIGWLDGHEYPGYVQREELFELLVYNECQGISTRFPHNSHLYKFFASKEWTCSQCLNPQLNTPLTTKIPRALIVSDPRRAALQAIEALNTMSYGRNGGCPSTQGMPSMNFNFSGEDFPAGKPKEINKGVAKLGFSWEALDVRKWTNAKELEKAIIDLAEQTGSQMDYVFVQEWVDFDIEVRNYVVLPDVRNPESCIPKGTVCTMFQEETANGGFTNFNRFSRADLLPRIFNNDEVAFANCSQKINELIYKWLIQLRAECSEPPVCVRFDILVKYLGNGKVRVTSGELTELGGCFLGWAEGPQTIFDAVINSYFGRLSKSVNEISSEINKLQNSSRNPNQNQNQHQLDIEINHKVMGMLGPHKIPAPIRDGRGPNNAVMSPPNQQQQQQQNQGNQNHNGNPNQNCQQQGGPGPNQQMTNANGPGQQQQQLPNQGNQAGGPHTSAPPPGVPPQNQMHSHHQEQYNHGNWNGGDDYEMGQA